MGSRFVVVGAGLLGLAVARRVQEVDPGAAVTVVEKEDRVAAHQSSHNSGVVHAGVYYTPGSAKARFCGRGRKLLWELCERHGLPYEVRGKVVVATSLEELPRLEELHRRSLANGVPGVRLIGAGELGELEPHVAGVAALHSPATAITDYPAVAGALAGELTRGGGDLRLGWEVTAIQRCGAELVVRTKTGEVTAERVIVCAGLHADRVARSAGGPRQPAIVPFRGEYHRLAPALETLVRGLVYPVPDPRYPFLGVHFTPRVGGGVEVGPNAVLALSREGYRRRDVRFSDLADLASYRGFWRLVARHWRAGAAEEWTSLSARAYLELARRYLPELRAGDLTPAGSGVRAQAVRADGTLEDDFVLGGSAGLVTIRNAPSPAATSSLAIAEEVVARSGEWR